MLTESDYDATYYGAVNAFLGEQQAISDAPLDLLITHTNGSYSRYANAITALSSAGTPVVSVVDIDIVVGNEVAKLIKIVEAHGGDVDEMALRKKSEQITAYLNGRRGLPGREKIRREFERILSRPEPELSPEECKTMQRQLSHHTARADFKRIGVSYLKGDAKKAMKDVAERCAHVGVFIVPTGELENWHDTGRSKRDGWLVHALSSGIYRNPGGHQDFMREIRAYLADRQK